MTNKVIGIVAVLALLVGGYAAFHAGSAGPQGPQGPMGMAGKDGANGADGLNGRNGANGAEGQKFGATATLDGVDNPYVAIGGARFFYGNKSITATSSTLCSFKNPFGATSTVFAISMTSATSGLTSNGAVSPQFIDIATSTTNLGTSTPAFVKKYSTPSSGGFAFAWQPVSSTTNISASNGVIPFDQSTTTGASPYTVGPNEYLNFKVASGTPGAFTYYYNGSCTAVFEKN